MAMRDASFCRLASAVRCCKLAVAEGALDSVSSLMATVVSQYCSGKGRGGDRDLKWTGDMGSGWCARLHPLGELSCHTHHVARIAIHNLLSGFAQ